jgi:hypothetical protein
MAYGTKVVTESLDRGVSGTEKTIDKMHKLVALGKLDPTIQKIATWIRAQVPGDYRGSSTAVLDQIFYWVKKHGMFQRDPFQIEKIEHPIESMRPIIEARRAGAYKGHKLFVGDCDTMAGVFTAALGGVLGFQYSFETTKVDGRRPDEFSHVLVSFLVKPGEWYALDPSTPSAKPGWRPPVAADRMRRWQEKPIEDVVGGGMSGLNGHGLGNGESNGEFKARPWLDPKKEPYYPEDYFGYGIPKSFNGKMEVPRTTGGEFEEFVGQQPQTDPIDLERPASDPYKRSAQPNPTRRYGDYAEMRTRRPNYVGKKSYVNLQKKQYPAGSRWNQGRVDIQYEPRVEYIHLQPPRENDPKTMEVAVDQPMAMLRREGAIVMEPRRESAGMSTYLRPAGMSQIPGLVTSLDDPEPAQAPAVAAAGSIWDSVVSTIGKVAVGLAPAATAAITSKYQIALAKATGTVTGVQVAPTAFQKTVAMTQAVGTTLLSSPWVWVGGVLVIGGIAYALTAGKKSKGTRRRYRRNPRIRHRIMRRAA